MPNWLIGYLNRSDLKTHFARALVVGLSLRLLSAYFVYGPQALDDYKHGVWPAYQFFAGLPLEDFPDYRSHLLVWFLSGFVSMASWLGVVSAVGQVRAMYMGLATTSLLGVLGTYWYVRHWKLPNAAAIALYLIAAYPLMPFVSTRAFGESVAMTFVLLGFGALEQAQLEARGRLSFFILGFLSLGIATLFRFHCGLLYLAVIGVALIRRQWLAVGMAIFCGSITLATQILIDHLSGRAPLGTLLSYLAENEGGAAKYGASPWYGTWLFVLGIALVPFSLTLWRGAWRTGRDLYGMLIPFFVFVAAHSFVPHKEERFLYPILGLELWALAYLWALAETDRFTRKVFYPALVVVCTLLLPVVCFVNSQEGEIEPPAYVQSHFRNVSYLDDQSLFGQSRFQFYFLRPPSQLTAVASDQLTAHRIDLELAQSPDRQAVVLLTSELDSRDRLRALQAMKTAEAECGPMREAGSLIDRLLYKMNPKHNQRRKPTWYLICERLRRV